MAKRKIGIIGLGMIGGSLAKALSDKFSVLGYDNDIATCEYAESNGFCVIAPPEKMGECEIVFVCVPLAVMQNTLDELHKAVGDKVILSDVGSVKQPFANSNGRYVGGHPMAGTERGGIKAAKAHLFQNAYWVITGEGEDAERVKEVVEATGAIPVKMTAEEHDRAVGEYSHTPHAVAYALVSSALGNGAAPIAGSGFLDMTRIAQSDEKFWTEVFKLNRDNVLSGISSVTSELNKISEMLSRRDYKSLESFISSARQGRAALNRPISSGEVLYVDLVDRIGEFERITGAIARAGINITGIALVPNRDGAGGALRLEFECLADKLKAKQILSTYETN